MEEKCFCHFNGYQVKDATARRSIEEQAAKIEEQAAKIEEQAEENIKSIQEVKPKVAPFSLDNVVCIGDSFLDGAMPVSDGYVSGHGWGKYLEEMAKNDNPKAMFLRGLAEGWSGFMTKGLEDHTGHTYAELVSEQASVLGDDERKAVNTVIMIGGVNDVSAGKTINITDAVETAKSEFPNAKIVLAMSPLCTKVNTAYFQQLRYPSTDPRVCVLTDSYQWLIPDYSTKSSDGLHPSANGYKRIAAHLYYASKGLSFETSYQYTKTYSGDFGTVHITFSKTGNNVSFYAVGSMNEGFTGPVKIGAFPSWMDATRETLIPIWSDVPGVALDFRYGELCIFMPYHAGTATINGCATISLDMI